MWAQAQAMKNGGMSTLNKLIAVAIDKDKGSQIGLRWAVDNLVVRGQTIILIHVRVKGCASSFSQSPSLATSRVNLISDGPGITELDPQLKDLFLPFRVFCTRKDIQCYDVVLEDSDVVKAITEYVNRTAIEVLVLGATAKAGLLRFKVKDIPANVIKGVPHFCTVYVISKTGKIASTKSATRLAPFIHPLRHQFMQQGNTNLNVVEDLTNPTPRGSISGIPKHVHDHPLSNLHSDTANMKSPFTHRKAPNGRPYELSHPDTDISYVTSGRPSIDNMFPSFADTYDGGTTPPRLSGFSELEGQNLDSMQFGRKSLDMQFGRKSVDMMTPSELSFLSVDADRPSFSQPQDDVAAEMRRLKLELKQTMEMYSSACKEALTAQQKAMELQRWKTEEERRLEEARFAEEAALAIAEKEKAKSRAALEHAEAAQRLAELEAQKRISAEMKALKEAEEKNKVLNKLANSDFRYRKYSIDEIEVATEYFSHANKIGEGGYGPVYKCYMDHTHVAVKVLRPDATHGRQQFQQEVEVLSCIRHPNMVLLLGACPEYGCLVYEFMSNGSLEDRLFLQGKTPPLSWQQRFRITAEIGAGLLFLHQSKPEPIVHRDLKPANILLDRNFVSKISDVGLARLVPPSVADSVTQYRMTSTAGTFCYIDPEYQQTGMLGIKSDVYSLGIIFLQILTAKPPMGLTHHVERAIEKGTFTEMLDTSIPDWPLHDAFNLAKLSLKCSELRRKDRPDLGKVVMPELERLRQLGEQNPSQPAFHTSTSSPNHTQLSMSQQTQQ